MGAKVTIEDIAKRCNLSCAQISRALNDKYGVSEETRSRIRIIAMEMGYDFRNITRKSKKAPIKHVSVVVTRADLLDENFYGKIVCGIETELKNRQLDFCLSIVEEELQVDLISKLKKNKADGIITLGLISYKNIVSIIACGIPLVIVDSLYQDLKVNYLTANNYMGGYDATDFLLNAGFRRLAFLGDMGYSRNFMERYRGYLSCIKNFSIKNQVDIEDVSVTTEYTSGDMRANYQYNTNDIPFDIERTKELLMSENRPHAVLCANDSIAFHVYQLAKEQGLNIPEDLSVIGFDNSKRCETMQPPLTSIHVPKFEMGQEAVKRLCELIDNIGSKVTYKMEFVPTLMERESVKVLEKTN